MPPVQAPPTFPLVGYGYVAQLQGDRVPDESVLEKVGWGGQQAAGLLVPSIMPPGSQPCLLVWA